MKKRKLLFYIALAFALACVLSVGALWVDARVNLNLAKLEPARLTTTIYDAADNEAASVYGAENRVRVSLGEVPARVRNAFLAAEDARFYTHHGVDPYRIAGAIVADIRAMRLEQGASTITQQLIKLTHLSSEKRFLRKAREAAMALRLETLLTKDEILEKYLNIVYFGAGAYGVETAANTYFQKSTDELRVDEAALLAGILKSPSAYAPHLNAENARARRDSVLKSMLENGFIDDETYAEAVARPVELNMRTVAGSHWYADYALREARELLDLSADELLAGGYRIYTHLDAEIQREAEALFADAANFPANADDGTLAQGALAAVDTRTGGIRALVGGRNSDAREAFNRAAQMRRQPGSAFKPLSAYAAAIDRYGYLPTDFITDAEKDYGGYVPRNASGRYSGEVTLENALSNSLNAAAVELLSRVGVESARAYAERLGIELSDTDNGLSLVLGSLTDGASPLQMAGAYAALGNGGVYTEPRAVRRIEGRDGRVLYEETPRAERALRPQSAYLITTMLEKAAREGTAKALGDLSFDVAAKTGTVGMRDGQNKDAWVVAYTGAVSVAVWMGFDYPDETHAMLASEVGGARPARLAARLLASCPQANGSEFVMPEGLTRVLLDETALTSLRAAYLAGENTPSEHVKTAFFPKGRAPQTVSTLWDTPESVRDLRRATDASGNAALTFTALDENCVYLVYRDGEQVAALSGAYGEQLRYEMESADGAYEVVARNEPLYRLGETRLSPPATLGAEGEKPDVENALFG